MIAKEKAIELVDRFWSCQIKENAKQCALICADEILKANEKISLKDLSETMQTKYILYQLTDNAMYWQEVKQEINKL